MQTKFSFILIIYLTLSSCNVVENQREDNYRLFNFDIVYGNYNKNLSFFLPKSFRIDSNIHEIILYPMISYIAMHDTLDNRRLLEIKVKKHPYLGSTDFNFYLKDIKGWQKVYQDEIQNNAISRIKKNERVEYKKLSSDSIIVVSDFETYKNCIFSQSSFFIDSFYIVISLYEKDIQDANYQVREQLYENIFQKIAIENKK